jgi:hypothetical protein
MALPDVFRVQSAAEKIFKTSPGAGEVLLTLTSLANNAARQSDKCDLGATRAAAYDVFVEVEMAATPTAGNSVEIWWGPSPNATAANENVGNLTGSDAAYSGYSSNLDATLPQLQLAGNATLTAQATTTVQKIYAGRFSPAQRYGQLVVVNRGGSAMHSSAANMRVRLVPLEGVVEDT